MGTLLRGRTTAAIAIMLTLLACALVATGFFVRKQAIDQLWVEHTLAIQLRLGKVSALLQDAEAAQRGYLITDRSRFFDEFVKATAAVPAELDALDADIADNPRQVETLNALRVLASDRLMFLGQAVELQKNGRQNDAVTLIKTGRGKILMDQGTDALARMFNEEQRLLNERQDSSRTASLLVEGAVGGSLFLAVVLGVFVMLDAVRVSPF